MSRSFGKAVEIATPIVNGSQYCCSFGWVGDKHEEHFRNQPCHFYLRQGSRNEDVKYYYTTLSTTGEGIEREAEELKLTNGDLEKYGLYLLGENSPFKSFLGDRERELVKNKDGKPTGFVIEVSPKDSLDNLFGFSVAARYTKEKLPGYALMLKLIASGLHPSEAWYITHFFMEYNGSITTSGYYATGHTNFDSNKINLKRLLEGNPYEGKIKVRKEPAEAPRCTANFWLKEGVSKVERNLFPSRVKPTGGVVGRWSNTKGVVDVDALVKSWSEYRDELLAAA